MKGDSVIFLAMCKGAGLPVPTTEHKFHPDRRWRFDYAWPDLKVALEVEGGIWSGGRHTRGAGYAKDMEKYSEAAILGWAVIRCTPDQLCRMMTLDMVKRAVDGRAGGRP